MDSIKVWLTTIGVAFVMYIASDLIALFGSINLPPMGRAIMAFGAALITYGILI